MGMGIVERRLERGGGEWLRDERYRTLNRVPEKAIPAKPADNFLSRFSGVALIESDVGDAIPHAVGTGSFNRVPSGPRLFYLKFRI